MIGDISIEVVSQETFVRDGSTRREAFLESR
jgi:hypothetical protein